MFKSYDDKLITEAYRQLSDDAKTTNSLEEFTQDVAEKKRQREEPEMSVLVGKICRGSQLTAREQAIVARNQVERKFTKDHFPAWVAVSKFGNPIRIPMLVSPFAQAILCWWSRADAERVIAQCDTLNHFGYTLRQLSSSQLLTMQGWWGWVGIPDKNNRAIETQYYSQLQVVLDLCSARVEDIRSNGDTGNTDRDALIKSIAEVVAELPSKPRSGQALRLKHRADLSSPRYETDEFFAIELHPLTKEWGVVIQGIVAAPLAVFAASFPTLDEAKAEVAKMYAAHDALMQITNEEGAIVESVCSVLTNYISHLKPRNIVGGSSAKQNGGQQILDPTRLNQISDVGILDGGDYFDVLAVTYGNERIVRFRDEQTQRREVMLVNPEAPLREVLEEFNQFLAMKYPDAPKNNLTIHRGHLARKWMKKAIKVAERAAAKAGSENRE